MTRLQIDRKANPRYAIVQESASGHCCFEATILDLHMPAYEGSEGAKNVCECFDEEDARRLLSLLNGDGVEV